MNFTPEKTISLVEASRLIFRTSSPNEAQVGRVQKLMKAGQISECHCDGPPLRWTTTPAAVADYLAKESLEKQEAKQASHSGKTAPTPSLFTEEQALDPQDAALKTLYQGIWREYFLTVFMQKKAAHQSAKFRRAVLAGQVLLFFLLVGSMFGLVRLTMKPVPPQRAVVERWLEENTDHYTIQKWHPPQPAEDHAGVIMRVEYSYLKDSRRRILTDRSFLVAGDDLQLLSPDE